MEPTNTHLAEAARMLAEAKTIGYKLDKAQAEATLAVAEELAGLRRDIQALVAVLTQRDQV